MSHEVWMEFDTGDEHTHGAWCHPSAEGCPDLMPGPTTPPVSVKRGRRTRHRGAPIVADEAWWLAFAVIAALLVALHSFL